MPPRITRALCVIALLLPAAVFGQDTRARDPALAVVRITNLGASGTVIATAPGKSYILSCAHMFQDPRDTTRPLRLHGPRQPHAPPISAKARVVAVDRVADLSLIALDNGPFFYLPVAPPGHRPAVVLESLGYDQMQWPVTRKRVHLLAITPESIFTRERPGHGRSGGPLIDPAGPFVVGVVQGYELYGLRRGIYVSHTAVLRFLRRHAPGLAPGPIDPRQAPSPGTWPMRPRTSPPPVCIPGGL